MCWLVGAAMLTAGCTTSNIDTALTPEPLPPAPQTVAETGSDQPTVETAQLPQSTAAPSIASQAPEPTAYPNINNEPVGETAQLSAADQQAMRATTENAKQSVDVADESAAYAARLKKLKLLALTHAKRTQDEIEGN